MTKNNSIAHMKNRTSKSKQPQDTDEPPAKTVANTFREASSDLTAQINVRLTPKLRNKLNAYCLVHGTSVQELVSTFIEEHLEANPIDFEAEL